MKRFLLLVPAALLALAVQAAPSFAYAPGRPASTALRGAWMLVEKNRQELSVGMNVTMLITNGYAAWTCYDRVSRKYFYTGGGPYQADKASLTLKLEFNTEDSTQVGTTRRYDYVLKGRRLALNTPAGEEIWERLETPAAAPLTGVWRITGREQEGKMTQMPAGSRKTLKILAGTRFMWVALNPETRQVFGTGGGTYQYKDGQYTETIEFFPRDPRRVGASLGFEAVVVGSRWTHRGRSTTGQPVHEIWERQD